MTTIAIAIVGRAIAIEREMKQRNETKNKAKGINSDNFIDRNIDKYNIAIVIIE